MVIGGLVEVELLMKLVNLLNVSQGNLFLAYTIIVWIVFSAFVDNIPYVLTMLPVVGVLGASFGFIESPAYVLYFGLLVGATLGGNLTPIGASANITAIGILRKEFMKLKQQHS